VTVTIEGNIAYLEAVEAKARQGAGPVATAMARYIYDRTRNQTLRRRAHGPGQYYKAARGDPPAFASGRLARAMFFTPAYGNERASATVGNRSEYGRVLEYGGCVLQPTNRDMLKWRDSMGWWSHRKLPLGSGEMPAHPYLGRTTDEATADGELLRVAIEAFRDYDP
jgi:phage gpG-like protein